MPKAGDPYTGPVGFQEPWHYPPKLDRDGNEDGLDLDHPLVSLPDGSYVYAGKGDVDHFTKYHQDYVVLPL